MHGLDADGFVNVGGRDRWVNMDNLSVAAKTLIRFEPAEVVRVKGEKFEVRTIQLDPPLLVLVPLHP